MKKKLLNISLNMIKKYQPNYNDNKYDEIRYGLESIYLTLTKIIIIFIAAYYLGIFSEMIILMIFYNILRFTGFGLHASKSLYCLLLSLLLFIGLPIILKFIYINFWLKVLFSCLSIFAFYKYAPADTEKRPLINKKKRTIYKYLTVFTSIIYTIFIIIFNNNLYSNILFFALIIEVLFILPITYKIFNLKFDNYKSYQQNY